MDVLVFGAGSLGSLIGGLLAREHDVTLVGRDPHMRAVRTAGLRIVGALDDRAAVRAVTELDAEVDADLAVIAVKSYDTLEAARALVPCSLDAVLSVQNGMGNEELFAETLSVPVLAGTTTFGARLREPGIVACTGTGTVTLGPHGDTPYALAEDVGSAFRASDLETTIVPDMQPPLWRKLAVNAGINPVTALAHVENGALREEPARGITVRAALETATVARDRGVDLPDDDAKTAVLEVVEATASNSSSMRQDVESGRRTEIDAINGYVVDRASNPVPVNETLYGLIRTREQGADN